MTGEMSDVLKACQRSSRDMELQVVSLTADHMTLKKPSRPLMSDGYTLEVALRTSGDGSVTLNMEIHFKFMPVSPAVRGLAEGSMGQFANGVSVELEEVARHRASQEPQAGPQFSVADELEKLADLRDRGVLSDEEFEEQKSKLLAG